MPALVTNKFRIHNAKQFIEAFDEVSFSSGAAVTDSSGLLNSNMYLFIGKVTGWSDDASPPSPTDSVANTHYENWRDMIAAKRIASTDVSHAIPRKNWTNNTSYFAYTDNTATLFSQDFYVMTGDYNVYKCLSNSETNSSGTTATTSTTKPTGSGTSIISTADGYKWKFMYQISAADALKFVTPNYIPVDTVRRANGYLANTFDLAPAQVQYDVETATAASGGGNGAIEVVHLTTRGLQYLSETGNLAGVTNTTVVTITGTALGADDCIVNNDIYFTSGDASGEGGTITDYNGTTKVVTFTPAVTAPASTDGYAIGPKVVISGDGQGANVRCTVNSTGGINIILFQAETIIPMHQFLLFLMLPVSLALEFKKVLTPIIGKKVVMVQMQFKSWVVSLFLSIQDLSILNLTISLLITIFVKLDFLHNPSFQMEILQIHL